MNQHNHNDVVAIGIRQIVLHPLKSLCKVYRNFGEIERIDFYLPVQSNFVKLQLTISENQISLFRFYKHYQINIYKILNYEHIIYRIYSCKSLRFYFLVNSVRYDWRQGFLNFGVQNQPILCLSYIRNSFEL